jgi:hypothetical protein
MAAQIATPSWLSATRVQRCQPLNGTVRLQIKKASAARPADTQVEDLIGLPLAHAPPNTSIGVSKATMTRNTIEGLLCAWEPSAVTPVT